MDISAATTFAAGIVALVAPALVQAFKKYIPADYVGLTPLGVSILLGVIAIAAVVLFSIKDGSFVKKAEASWTSNAR